MGVVIDWYPRDAFRVALVRLVDGDFPERYGNPLDGVPIRYFELGDIEVVKTGQLVVEASRLDGPPPSETTAVAVAESLRDNASDLLRGELGMIPELERRIRERVARLRGQGFGA
jgi:hypothetical protein